MTNNRVLAAAIATVVDRIQPRSKRPFSVAEFAATAIGEEHKTLVAKSEEATRRLRAARDLNKSFVSGKSNPNDKIERGLGSMQAKGQKSVGFEPDDLGKEVSRSANRR